MTNTNALRCSNCKLVNFSTAPFCKRCKMPFQNSAAPPQAQTVNININIPVPAENININTPFNEAQTQRFQPDMREMPQFQQNQPQFGNPQANYFQDTDSYQPQNQQGFEQWQQMNAPVNAPPMRMPIFPHPRQMPTNGILRHGTEVVVHRNASMPDRCVKCNEPLAGYKAGGFARQKYRWHNPLVYIALISPLIYVILSLVLSHRMTVDIPLCHKHLEDRKTTGSYLAGAGILSVFAIFFFASLGYGGFAFLLFLGAIIGFPLAYEYTYKPLQASKIENDYIYLKGASEEYIRNLPYC